MKQLCFITESIRSQIFCSSIIFVRSLELAMGLRERTKYPYILHTRAWEVPLLTYTLAIIYRDNYLIDISL